jgi:PAS domain S-box-containing protein
LSEIQRIDESTTIGERETERLTSALQACELRLRNIITRSADGIVIVDAGGRIVLANPAAEILFDRPAADLVGDLMGFPVVAGETTELDIVRRGGERSIAEMRVAETDWEEGPAYLCTLRDITERRRSEEKLRESKRALSTLMGNLPGMAYRCRNDGNWTMEFVSEGCASLTGYGPDALIHNREIAYGDLINTDDRCAVWDDVQAALEEDRPFELVYRIATAAGEEKWVWEQGCGVFSPAGELLVLEGFVIDITARKLAEEKVEALNAALAVHADELQAANKDLEAFNYSVSHDLRTPLSAVSGYVQIVQDSCGDRLDERCRGYLREVHDAGVRMGKLIDTLLGFSRLSHVKLRRETVDLSAVARGVAGRLRESDHERRVEFRVAEGVTATGDKNLLRVVLENLIGNAWKYTGIREKGIIEFGVSEEGGERSFFIRDNGAGFDMAHAEHLFIPFQRLPGAERFKGHGIGLATVERIVRRHGGKVWAEGEPGKGAAFYFTLPEKAEDSGQLLRQ